MATVCIEMWYNKSTMRSRVAPEKQDTSICLTASHWMSSTRMSAMLLFFKLFLWCASFFYVVQTMVFYTLFDLPINILVFTGMVVLLLGVTVDLFAPSNRPINLQDWVNERKAGQGGYVYIIKDIEVSQTYKIGKTVRPYERMKKFAVHLPFEVELIHVIPCTNPSEVEAMLHRRFADKRVRGEWFDLSQHDIDWLFQIYRG